MKIQNQFNRDYQTRMTLENLLNILHNHHKRHGVIILYNEPIPLWTRVIYFWLKLSTFLLVLLVFLASFSIFSNNNLTIRMFCFLVTIGDLEVIVTESLFWTKRNEVLELVEWCRKVEALQVETFHKPYTWFYDRRHNVRLFIRLFSNCFVAIFVLVAFVGPIIQTIVFDGYHLTLSFDFKNLSERDSLPILFLEFSIITSASWFLVWIFHFSFMMFIVISNQVIGQLELIKHYIEQLDLGDVKKLRYQLAKVTELHLDTLRAVRKLSGIFKFTLKSKELILYCYVSLLIFGKETMSIMVPPAAIGLLSVVGIYCDTCEKIMEAEEDIRNAYYKLDWYTTSLESKKLLLLAMQEPEQVRFGRFFHSDYASMERFLLLIQRAYDFALALLKLAKQ